MRRVLCASAAIVAVLGCWRLVEAASDRPGPDFRPKSSVHAPCGVGAPPPGHFAPEVAPADLPGGLKLIVKQDPDRLCYVAGDVAEAPVIRTRQGADLVITLRNEITDPAAIDTLVTPAKLDRPNLPVRVRSGFYPVVSGMRHPATGVTNLHVHGFAVPPVAPQDEVLTTCVDPAVGPAICGQREVTYHYHVPATMPAGLYWYHPHTHGEVHAQMLMGLSGAIVVEGPEDDARRAAGIKDRVFVIRQTLDVSLQTTQAGVLAHGEQGESQRERRGSGQLVDSVDELDCSSETGLDELTLNGAKILDGAVADRDLAPIRIGAGTTELWRVLNAANDAFLDLAVIDEHGAPLPIKIVARDGAPLSDDAGNRLPALATTASQFVPPSGRVEFLIEAPPQGHKAYLVTHAVDTGCAGDKVPERRLALITPAAAAGPAPAPARAPSVPPRAAAVAPTVFAGLLARATDRRRVIALAEYPRPGDEDQTDFYIMERKPGAEFRPYEMNGPPMITVTAGAVEEWVIENWTNELHAFHIHQVHFRVLEVNGQPASDQALLDVVNVPYATPADARAETPAVPGRVRIKVMFPEDLAGDIPFHCHLTDHEDNGMMAIIRVLPTKLGSLDQPSTSLARSESWPPSAICRTKRDE